jgi:hypothetical protein
MLFLNTGLAFGSVFELSRKAKNESFNNDKKRQSQARGREKNLFFRSFGLLNYRKEKKVFLRMSSDFLKKNEKC